MNAKERLGLTIRTVRNSHGMTQLELAEAIDQSPSSVSMYERGQREPDMETLEAIADVFNIPMSAFSRPSDVKSSPEIDTPKTKEARIISGGIDKMPKEKREYALKVFQTIFADYADQFIPEEEEP